MDVDSLPLPSLLLSVMEQNTSWTKPRLGKGSPLLSGWEQTQGRDLSSWYSAFCCVSCSAGGPPNQSAWGNGAILLWGFCVGFFLNCFILCGLTVTCIGATEEMGIAFRQVDRGDGRLLRCLHSIRKCSWGTRSWSFQYV